MAFNWSIVSSDWEDTESQVLLELVVNLFVTIRFSYASAWMEKFKAASAKMLKNNYFVSCKGPYMYK